MPRRNFLLTLAYDGTDFQGWQRLPGAGRSVQGSVEEALAGLLGEAVELTGAGRTDAGAHAEGQGASFHSRTTLAPAAIKEALNGSFPGDLACLACREVDPRFHARFRAKAKVYRYRIRAAPDPDPFARRYSLHVPVPLDRAAMVECAAHLVGERDFRAFSNAKGEDTVRRIDEARIEEHAPFVDMLFVGPGFLYNQVRIMAAVVLEAGLGRLEPADLPALLAGRERRTVPGALGAFGLCLVEVRYGGAVPLAGPALSRSPSPRGSRR
jgi:tRNA pseudouridine38-40 synthase